MKSKPPAPRSKRAPRFTERTISEGMARVLFRRLPGWKTRPPTRGEVELVGNTLRYYRRYMNNRLRRKKKR